MMVPALVVKLNEPDSALREPARQQAVGGKCAVLAGVRAVHFEHTSGLFGESSHVRNARLHPVRHLILGYPRLDLGIELTRKLLLVERPQRIQHRTAAMRR